MKNNKILSLAAGLLLSCAANLGFAQAYKTLTLTPEMEQDAKALISAVKADPENLEAALKPFMKKYKRNDKALLAIGTYCFEQKEYSPTISLSQYVYERDPESLASIHLEGDTYFALERYGEAAAKYEEAITVAEKDRYAYFKKVDVYKYINPGYSLETMNTIKEKYPDDPAIDKTMASIYYFLNDTAKANETYKNYFKNVQLVDDVEAATEFAIVRFINKEYQGSLEVVEAILPKNPEAISLKRMKFYDLVELGKFEEATAASKTFFETVKDTSLLNFSDYKYEGRLQGELGNAEAATKALQIATEKAPNKPELFKDLSANYKKIREYDKAAEAYQTFINKTNPESIRELINLGRIYYDAVIDTMITDSAARQHFVDAGDAAFKVVAEKDAESYVGPRWRARINSQLDPNGAVERAMEQYAETYKRLEGKSADYDAYRVECLRYMAFYYLKVDEYDKCEEYANKVIALDPEDGLANQILPLLKRLKK